MDRASFILVIFTPATCLAVTEPYCFRCGHSITESKRLLHLLAQENRSQTQGHTNLGVFSGVELCTLKESKSTRQNYHPAGTRMTYFSHHPQGCAPAALRKQRIFLTQGLGQVIGKLVKRKKKGQTLGGTENRKKLPRIQLNQPKHAKGSHDMATGRQLITG